MNHFDEIKKLATADGLRLICPHNFVDVTGNTGILIKDNCFSSVKNSVAVEVNLAAIPVNLIAPDFNAEYQRAKKGLMKHIERVIAAKQVKTTLRWAK